MKEMKTLTVNGVTYAVTDPNAARIDDSTVGMDAWSGKNIIDRLCPSFTESGAVVTCEPVEGYPLEVVTAADAAKVYRCGKNCFSTTFVAGVWNFYNKTNYVREGFYRTAALIPVAPGMTYRLSGTASGYWQGNMAFYDKDKNYLGDSRQIYTFATFTVPADACYMAFHMQSTYASMTFDPSGTVQLELGTAKTDYEPYSGGEFNPGDPVPALFGINTIWANVGEVTVTGKADPVTIINKLTNAIVALDGNV